MTTEPPWQYEIRLENASPRLRESFARSARSLLPNLNEAELRYIELSYLNPESEDEPARAAGFDSRTLDLVAAAIGWSPDAATRLVDEAADEHRDPFLAIASQAFMLGEPDDPHASRRILVDLATRAEFAEAAALLASSGTSDAAADRADWRARALAIWPPAVRNHGKGVVRTISFGSYYLAHLLEARDELAQ